MQYHDILLPDFISTHLKGGPVFATTTATTISGREIRSYERQNSIQKYMLEGCKLSHDEFERFNSFFRSRIGCAYAFRIRDHADYKIDNQLFAIADGQTKEFEIYKTYKDEACSYRRKISAVRSSSLQINCDIEKIDEIRGIIYTKDIVAPNKELVITAEFDVWVRFMSDEFSYSGCEDGSILIEDLKLIEVI